MSVKIYWADITCTGYKAAGPPITTIYEHGDAYTGVVHRYRETGIENTKLTKY